MTFCGRGKEVFSRKDLAPFLAVREELLYPPGFAFDRVASLCKLFHDQVNGGLTVIKGYRNREVSGVKIVFRYAIYACQDIPYPFLWITSPTTWRRQIRYG